MNTIQTLASQPWVERLGWTLVHFLWQGLALAALYAGARRNVTRPNARYLLACAALAAMMAAPLVTWIALRPAYGPIDPAYRVRYTPPTPSAAGEFRLPANVPAAANGSLLPWVVALWLTGAMAFWIRLAGGWVVSARMRSMLVRPAPAEWQQAVRRLGVRIGVYRPVPLLISALVQVPTVVGWLRPVVLVPVGALAGLPAEHLEALLLHELAHIRRHDYLVNILQSVAEALLFYHPAVWWVSGHLRHERELCCDDVAVAVTGDALTYARALLEWEQCRPAYLPAVAANGGSLAGRIARLLGQSRPVARTSLGPGVLTVGILLLAAAYSLLAQSAERPAFQVASVKRTTDPNPPGMIVRPQPGGRLTAINARLMMLMVNAYSVQPFQIVGAPDWVNTEGYDIEAKPETPVDRMQMWLMLRTLLADRFKLTLHRDTKELPVFALVVGKDGLKKPDKESDCPSAPPDPNAQPTVPGGVPCGRVVIGMAPSETNLRGGKVAMPEFVRMLSMVLGRPVLDRTGIATYFDVQLAFTPDHDAMGLPGAGGPGDPGGFRTVTDPNKPGIAAALQEQLGLKLTTTKGPVDVLVIDHIERPSAN